MVRKAATGKKATVLDPRFMVTPEGLADLKVEYEKLINNKRQEVTARIKNAREFGDISENAEYEMARDEQSFVEGRISELEEIINNAQIVISEECNEVTLGCKVRVHIDGTEEEFQIVGGPEANPSKKLISHESPLGKALIGKKVGEKASFEAPMGIVTYTILAIK